ncbi:MAG: heat-inducible transcriptional repressor HrcA [Waddliaceae bacterium]|nr:heat-inducible transcriptional repressor HrcA [Waddliaceae bacterium]
MRKTQPLKQIKTKRAGKRERELKVLLALVDLFISTGKPIGSSTLKNSEFRDLSSATIRNYFAHLEQAGFLKQLHSSGGRIPTEEAYCFYADHNKDSLIISSEDEKMLQELRSIESREVGRYLQDAAEFLSRATGTAVFLSAPRFDHDFVADLRLVRIDYNRCLCVIVTHFGLVETELLTTNRGLPEGILPELEKYFAWRLTGLNEPEDLEENVQTLGQELYNEIMVRYLVGYSNFSDEDIFRTGFSELLKYPEFNEAVSLATGLSLFENPQSMRLLLRDCMTNNHLRYWIGSELGTFASSNPNCAAITIPYRIRQNAVGAIGILGPMRMPYVRLFGILRVFTEYVSETLTKNVFRHRIDYRQPEKGSLYLGESEEKMVADAPKLLGK